MDSSKLNRVVALIKFFENEKFLNDFVEGAIYCNTPQFYREHKGQGVGDKSESCLKYWDKEAGDNMPEFTLDGEIKDLSNAKNVLVFPSREHKDSWLQCWATVGSHNEFENDIDRIAKECGRYFVVLPIENLPEYEARLKKGLNTDFSHGLVSYSNDPLKFGLAVKGDVYAYQREYRFLIGECDKSNTKSRKFSVGSLEDIVHVNGSLKFTKQDGTTIYFSNGKSLLVCSE
jgi:hypothetical protein